MKVVNNIVQSERQEFKSSVRSFLPLYTDVPFNQTKEKEYKCVVNEGDVVEEGQVLAVSSDNQNMGADIHSPVPGKIVSLLQIPLPNGRISSAVRIKLGGHFSYLGKKIEDQDWALYSPNRLVEIFAAKGVVNTFLNTIPLADQVKSTMDKKGQFLVVRLFDEDPSRETDTFIATHYTREVVTGAAIIACAMHASGIIFIKRKKSPIVIDPEILRNIPHYVLEADSSKYPTGFINNIISLVRKETRGTSERVFASVNYRSLFIDPETAYDGFNAVVKGIPVEERFVHVTGSCLKSAAMLKVRIGTPIKNLVEQCGGFKKKTERIIINGMITGESVATLNTPITKEVKAVLFVPYEFFTDQSSTPCVKCGKCRSVCLENLFPDILFRHTIGGKPVGSQMLAIANLCTGCSLCNSVCPARLPLSQAIDILKENNNG